MKGTILLSTQKRALLLHLSHLIDICSHSKNQKYKNLSSVRENTEHDNKNVNIVNDCYHKESDKEREHWNILFLIFIQFKPSNKLPLPLKSSKNHW